MAITISWSVLLIVIGLVVAGIGALSGKAKTRKMLLTVGLPMIGIFFIIMVVGSSLPSGLQFLNGPLTGGEGKSFQIRNTTIIYSAVGGQPTSTGGVNVQTYQPTASYSTVNHFSNVALTGGTVYYKAGSNKASSTAITNTDPNVQYQYWYSNTTYFVKPLVFNGGGTKTLINDQAYANGSVTINGYDLVNDKAITSSAYNTSLASGTAKFKFTVLGQAAKTQMPFGGVLVIEANSTISQITCSGDGISLTPSTQYQLTYTSAGTYNRYVAYEVAPGYDVSPNGLQGVTKTFNCEFTSSTDPGAASVFYVKLIPANYYYVNADGSFALDVEQKLNGLTTRTGPGSTTGTFYWG